jgi:regulator of replication initiation timing
MKLILNCLVLFALVVPLAAQHHIGRDPLAPEESDKLRDTAMEPNKRLKLYVDFARARMTSVDQVIADPKAKDKSAKLHDLLEDFSTLIDEISDNVEMFHGQHWDIRKGLKIVIEGDSEFQLKLRKLAESEADPKVTDDTEPYKFVLKDAIESLNNNAGDARHTMQEQNALAKDKKLKKEEDVNASF